MYDSKIVLAISCTHLPFEHKDFLDFCRETKQKTKAGKIVLLGDVVDNHAMSSHYDADPNGYSPADEMTETDKHLQGWFKAFPEAFITLGNHDLRIPKKIKASGLPDRLFKSFQEIWNTPKGWKVGFSKIIDDTYYFHGDGYSGDTASLKACINKRMSVVMGHLHTKLNVSYTANEKNMIFGANAGCGIDKVRYAFEYASAFKTEPILGCLTVHEGKFVQLHPMQ